MLIVCPVARSQRAYRTYTPLCEAAFAHIAKPGGRNAAIGRSAPGVPATPKNITRLQALARVIEFEGDLFLPVIAHLRITGWREGLERRRAAGKPDAPGKPGP